MNLKKVGLSLAVMIAVFGLVGYFLNSRDKEIIIDQGDGWKSYSHQDFGITVKIPSDADVEFLKEGDKKHIPTNHFSKGAISAIGISRYPKVSKPDDVVMKSRLASERQNLSSPEKLKNNEDGVDWKFYTKEMKIDGKIAFVQFTSLENRVGGREDWQPYFCIRLIKVPGKTTRHFMRIRCDQDYADRLYEKYSNIDEGGFSEEEIEKRMQAHLDVVDDFIISIDNF